MWLTRFASKTRFPRQHPIAVIIYTFFDITSKSIVRECERDGFQLLLAFPLQNSWHQKRCDPRLQTLASLAKHRGASDKHLTRVPHPPGTGLRDDSCDRIQIWWTSPILGIITIEVLGAINYEPLPNGSCLLESLHVGQINCYQLYENI